MNDAFVMDAWGKSLGSGDKVLMLADGNGQFAKALGVELDLADKGLGLRSRRYALLADDQVVKALNLEEVSAPPPGRQRQCTLQSGHACMQPRLSTDPGGGLPALWRRPAVGSAPHALRLLPHCARRVARSPCRRPRRSWRRWAELQLQKQHRSSSSKRAVVHGALSVTAAGAGSCRGAPGLLGWQPCNKHAGRQQLQAWAQPHWRLERSAGRPSAVLQ